MARRVRCVRVIEEPAPEQEKAVTVRVTCEEPETRLVRVVVIDEPRPRRKRK